ncbi:glycosyltransferase [Sulfuricurvum sp.]|uniref:glycosyltransferase n=1 Tax=Sulfuricurvum sp. TaxID=2025608 RepID=UPI003BAF3EAE
MSISCFTYNHEKFIRNTLNSFLMQETNFAIEILIHDDASTDNTAAIIKEYESKYPEIIKPIYQVENQYSKGIKLNITYNIPRALGKYIAFCDGDDYWTDPLKLQKQVDFLEQNPEFVGCSHNTKVINEINAEEDSLIVSSSNKDVFTIDDFTKGEAYFHTSSMVYRNNFKEKAPYDYLNKHRGDWFMLISFSKFGPIKYLDEVMSVYRVHDAGIWSLLDKEKQIVANLKAIIAFNKIFDYEYEKNFLELFTRISLESYKNNDVNSFLNLFNDINKDDLIKILQNMYSKTIELNESVHKKDQIIAGKNQIIAGKEADLNKLYSSKWFRLGKIIKKYTSFNWV